MFRPPIRQKTAPLLALFLCFWLSGTMCVTACGASGTLPVVTKHHSGAESIGSVGACPMHAGGEAKQPETEENADSVKLDRRQNQPPKFECCAFAYFLTHTAPQTAPADNQISTSAAATVRFNLPAAVNQAVFLKKTYQTIPQPRGQTYLRNRVFRI